MKRFRLVSIALLLCGQVVGASSTSAWVKALQSDDYAARLAGMNALESRIAHASAPSADVAQRAALELELLGYVASAELPELSRAYVIRRLPPIASEATVKQMLLLVLDAKTSRMLGNDAAGLLALLGELVPSATLLKSMQAASDASRELLWSAVSLRADPRLAKPLVTLLQQKKIPLDDIAIQTLGAMGGREAASFLSAQWRGAESTRRTVLARAIVHTGAANAAELKELCTRSDAPEIRVAALRQWASKEESAALQFLQSQVDSAASDIDSLIAGQLASGSNVSWKWITTPGATFSGSTLVTVLQSIREQKRRELEPWVLQRLEGASESVELAAVRCLGIVGGSKSIDALVARAQSSSKTLSSEAMNALAVLDDASLDSRLKGAMSHPQDPFYVTALELISLRNSPGSIAHFNTLFSQRSPEGEALAAGLRGLERLGTLESVKLMLGRLQTEKSPEVVRAMQISIKRVVIRLEQSDSIWKEAFLPALRPSPGAQTEARILPLLDVVATPEALELCIQRAKGDDAELARAAEQALIRWRSLDVCDYWLSVLNDPTKSDAARDQAVRSIDLTLRSDSQSDSPNRVMEKAAELFLASKNRELRTKLLTLVGGMQNRWKASFYKKMSPHASGLQDYREQLEALNKKG